MIKVRKSISNLEKKDRKGWRGEENCLDEGRREGKIERRLLGWINVVLTNRGFRFKENVTPISWDSSFLLRDTRGATSGSITKLGTSIPARLSLAHRSPCQFHAAVIRQSCRFSFEPDLPRCNLENSRECHEWNSWEWKW